MDTTTIVLQVCLSIAALCWAAGGVAYARNQWKESQTWEGGDDDDGPDQPGPYDIDPIKDPSDWWKHPSTKA